MPDGGIRLENLGCTVHVEGNFTKEEKDAMVNEMLNEGTNNEPSPKSDFAPREIPQPPQRQRDPKTGRIVAGPSVPQPSKTVYVLTKEGLMRRILDWVQASVFHWEVPTGQVPTTTIWLDWKKNPELAKWTDLVLEIDCAHFLGNTSEMSFAFPFDELKREYLAHDGRGRRTRRFQVPSRRFIPAQKSLFDMVGLVPGTAKVSYLVGVFYQREIPDRAETYDLYDPYYGDWQVDPDKSFLVLPRVERAPNVLVRIQDKSTLLEQQLAEHDQRLRKLCERPDVLAYHSVTLRREDQALTDLYLELDLEQTRRRKYVDYNRLKEHFKEHREQNS